jgi:hypothetical protein
MAARDVWIVFATAPAGGWVYKTDHFPRLYNYKKDAKAAAGEATKLGGTNVEVVKQTKDLASLLNASLPSYVSGKLFTHYIVRCERDQTIFGQEPRFDAVDRKEYDPVGGDRSITCPRCGRSYYYHNGGESADGKVGEWFSDRKLTILHDPSKRQRGEHERGSTDRGVRQGDPPQHRRDGSGDGAGTSES